jgi:hypothetical protein
MVVVWLVWENECGECRSGGVSSEWWMSAEW